MTVTSGSAAFRGECLSLAAQLEQYAKIDGVLPGVVAAMQESAAALRLAAKPAEEAQLLIERCAKIAGPWPGFWLDENSTDVDRAVVAVRTEIAKTIRALSITGAPKP